MEKKRGKPRFIRPSFDLKRKAVNFKRGRGLDVTTDLIAKFEEIVNNSQDRFAAQIGEILAGLRRDFPGPVSGETERHTYLLKVREGAYTIKGLGSTFGFPLATAAATSLDDFSAGLSEMTPRHLQIVRLHIDALYVILAHQITGAGSETDQQVVDGLNDLTHRFR